MLKTYFKVAWRNLIRDKAFSTINILGLALGLACCLLILLWVQDERSVDSFHANGNSLYQVYERNYNEGKVDASYLTQGLLANELKKAVPEIEYASSLERDPPYPNTFQAGDKVLKMNGTFAGADFFKMFSYPILQGKAETALTQPSGIAISQKMAQQFYGSAEEAIGKSIRFENKENLFVTAVFENTPANSTQQFDFLRNWQDYAKDNPWVNSWGSYSPFTFLQLHKDADPVKVEAKIKDFISGHIRTTKDSYTELGLQAFPEIYLHSNFKNGYIDGGRIEYVQLFSLLAVFILLIACINFMNLATARSTKRAKEVGIRKVVGAARSTLVAQFVSAAMLLTLFAVIIAGLLVTLTLPAFNDLTGKQLYLPIGQPFFWIALLCMLLVTGIVAGSYPALFLSSLNPIRVLKGKLRFGAGNTFFRKGLVVFQFTLSIIFIVSMIVIYRQVNYVQTKNLGYDRDNLLYIPIEGELISKYDVFKEKAYSIPGISGISKMKESPTVISHSIGDIRWTGKDPNQVANISDATVGYDFIKTMKLELTEGRDFSTAFNDSASYLLNETAVKKIGYQNPVGQPLWWNDKEGKIIGVLKDFHFNSLHETIQPLVIRLAENQKWGTILVRVEAGKTKQALAGLSGICATLNPAYPFTYQFSDEEYYKLYKNEQLISRLADYFAFLAIFISCLGLFGLATFTTGQRIKEIGVRKVLGASASNIVALLSLNFLKPVAISMLIAFPVSTYIMRSWLQGYAYKIGIEWWIFLIAGLVTISIALLTVSFQSIRSALSNPVKSLRTE